MSLDLGFGSWVCWTRDPKSRHLVSMRLVPIVTAGVWLAPHLYTPGPTPPPSGIGGFPFETPAGTPWARVHGLEDAEGWGTALFTDAAGDPVAVHTWNLADGAPSDSVRDRHLMGLGAALVHVSGRHDGLLAALDGRISVRPIYPTQANWLAGWSARRDHLDARFFEAIGEAATLTAPARSALIGAGDVGADYNDASVEF